MRKFNRKDAVSWKVVNFLGETLKGYNKEGKLVELSGFNGFYSAKAVALKNGGTPVRE